MKLIKNLILLLLITMNIFVSSARITSQATRRTKDSASAIKAIKAFFKSETFKNVKMIISFMMGVAASYYPAIEDIYNTIKAIKEGVSNFYTLVTKCNPFWGPAKKQFLDEENSNNTQKYEAFLSQLKDPVSYCKWKKEEYQNHQKILDDNNKYSSIPNIFLVTNACKVVPTDAITKESKADFKEMCEFFKNRDCDKELPKNPEESNFFVELVGTVKKYYNSINSQFESLKTCAKTFDSLFETKIYDTVKEKLQSFFKNLSTQISKSVANSFLGPIFQIVTSGAWGQIRAAYKVFKFLKTTAKVLSDFSKAQEVTAEIASDLRDKFAENAFKIGKVVGSVAQIIIAAVSGA